MTKLDAVRRAISLLTINARIIHFEYDPAGSTTQYEPDPRDLQILHTLIGRQVQDSELWFCCGGLRPPYFAIPATLLLEITLADPPQPETSALPAQQDPSHKEAPD
jgi:hypothetical protein